jgi:hypothetical protein
LIPVNNFSLKLDYINITPKTYQNGPKFEPMDYFITSLYDFKTDIYFRENEYPDLINTWKEKASNIHIPLFKIQGASVTEISIKDDTIFIPFGADHIELHFRITKPNMAFNDLKYPYRLRYIVRNFPDNRSYPGIAGVEIEGYWEVY